MITLHRRANAVLERGRDLPLLLARVTLGLLFIDHGLQKYHAKAGLTSFEYFLRSLKNIPNPGLLSHLVPALEVAGGVLLIGGLLTRVIALALAVEMALTAFLVKLHDLHAGVVDSARAGAELDIVYLMLLLVVLMLGPGRASIDAALGLEHRSHTRSPLPSAPAGVH